MSNHNYILVVFVPILIVIALSISYLRAAEKAEADNSMVGRYQLAAADGSDVYKIDTITGKVWHYKCISFSEQRWVEIK